MAAAAGWAELQRTLGTLHDGNLFLSAVPLAAVSSAVQRQLARMAPPAAAARGQPGGLPVLAEAGEVGEVQFAKLAGLAELLAATNVLSAGSANSIVALALRGVAAGEHRAAECEPKLLAKWCLQMAAAGVDAPAVIDALVGNPPHPSTTLVPS